MTASTTPTATTAMTRIAFTLEVPAAEAAAAEAKIRGLETEHSAAITAYTANEFTAELLDLLPDCKVTELKALVRAGIHGADDLCERTAEQLIAIPGVKQAILHSIRCGLGQLNPSRCLQGDLLPFDQTLESILGFHNVQELRERGVTSLAKLREMQYADGHRLPSIRYLKRTLPGFELAPTSLDRPFEDFGFRDTTIEAIRSTGIKTVRELAALDSATLLGRLEAVPEPVTDGLRTFAIHTHEDILTRLNEHGHPLPDAAA